MSWIEQAPIWVIGLAIMIGLGLAHEIGRWLGQRSAANRNPGSDTGGFLVSSGLTLLGLITGFAFGQAQERSHSRQELLVAEASAIGTAYRRVQILDEPWRSDLSGELREYAGLRVRAAQIPNSLEVEANARLEGAAQDRIWTKLGVLTRAHSDPMLNSALLQSVSDLFDLAAVRRAADETRVPLTVLRLLVLSCLLVAAIIGYSRAWEPRSITLFAGVMLLQALALCTILDLDRPSAGSVKVSQSALTREFENVSGEAPLARPFNLPASK